MVLSFFFSKRKEENAREKKTSHHKKLHFQFAALVHGNKTKQNTEQQRKRETFFFRLL